MFFKDLLNNYLRELNCTSKELSIESNISEAVISRYRSGQRIPKENSIQINNLINALYNISLKKNIKLNKKEIKEKLINSINEYNYFNYENFNNLISTMNININEMSKYIAFDSSHISRIRYGKTKPSDSEDFSKRICNYIFEKYNNKDSIQKLSIILECDATDLKEICNSLYNWLTKQSKGNTQINDFLNKLDSFDLNDYIKAIKFDKLKVPNIPFYRSKTRNYYGIEEMKNGELDFFKATVLSKSKEDIFMCSDMPMEDMAKDINFGKKWMFAIAMSLKKGLHLNIIHNLDRPFNEMMLGLESWIPIYMTGQISPFYLKDSKNNIYNHLNYTSGTVALYGECINGFHNKGKYYLTNKKEEVNYYKEKANLLLKKASPLMEIYNEFDKNTFKAFLLNDAKLNGERRRFLHSLPLFTIDDKLLKKILNDNKIPKEDINIILKYKKDEEVNINLILKSNIITDNIFVKTKEEFSNSNIYLSLENIFYNKKIKYNYSEYLEHIKSTKDYCKKNKNYKLNIQKNKTFSNISLIILENNYVIISKTENPNIHFVIKHPKLVDAIKNFTPLVTE